MLNNKENNPGTQMLNEIKGYVSNSSGLEISESEYNQIRVQQKIDKKEINFKTEELSEVLSRSDENGLTFLQVNFKSGKKILITDTLIGFKPVDATGIDLNRLPKVVTTPDILSVFEAIEESLGMGGETAHHEVEVLKKVYLSVIKGGEDVGFDLAEEKRWLERLMTTQLAATA